MRGPVLALALVLVATIVARTGVARADEEEPRPLPQPGYYGHHVAIADGVSAGMTGLGFYLLYKYLDCECEEFGSPMLIMLGVGSYVFTPAMLHHEHRRNGPMVLSPMLRLGLPLGAYAVAESQDASTGWIVGSLIGGAVSAMVIDWSLLSNDKRRVTPIVTPTGDGAAVGLAGSF